MAFETLYIVFTLLCLYNAAICVDYLLMFTIMLYTLSSFLFLCEHNDLRFMNLCSIERAGNLEAISHVLKVRLIYMECGAK